MEGSEKTNMKNEERKIDLVKALILSYPLLGESGFKLNKPIALICEDEKKQILWEKLSLFPKEQKLIPLTVKPKELEKNWVNAEYGVFFADYRQGRYTKQNMEWLLEAAQMVGTDIGSQKLILIFVTCCLPKDINVEGSLYFADLSGEESGINTHEFIHYLVRYENRIKSFVKEGVENVLANFTILEAAKCIWQRFMIEQIREKEIPNFCKSIAVMMEDIYGEWEEIENPESYVIALYRAISKNAGLLPPFLSRERIEAQEMNLIDDAIFYDDDAYYLPEQFFRFICERNIPSASVAYIKSKLAEAGVLGLEGKSRKYFTTKIEVVTVYGSILRVRRMKILREKIDQFGEFTLQELSLMREEEIYESDEWEVCETWEA
jgi:hypothetical protein